MFDGKPRTNMQSSSSSSSPSAVPSASLAYGAHAAHAAVYQTAVSLPREHLAAIQHIINDAVALQTRASRPPPPPYNHPYPHPHDSSPWFKPRMDLYQSASASGTRPLMTATFELPGLRKQDVHIDVLDDHMIVAGDRRYLPVAVPAPAPAPAPAFAASVTAAAVEEHTRDEEMKADDGSDGSGSHASAGAGSAGSAGVAAAAAAAASKDDMDAEEEHRVSIAGAPPAVAAAALQDPWEGYTVREIKRGRFKRVVPLPAGTKLEDVKASMHDGILTVTFPGSVRPVPRSIPVA